MIQDTTGVCNYDHGPSLSLHRFAERKEAMVFYSEIADGSDDVAHAKLGLTRRIFETLDDMAGLRLPDQR